MSILDAKLSTISDEVNAEHRAVRDAAVSALHHARRAGELLAQAKERLPHGSWLAWLHDHCPNISTRTAQGYMRIARDWPRLEANAQRVAQLGVGQALKLLAARRQDAWAVKPISDSPDWRADQAEWEQLRQEILYRKYVVDAICKKQPEDVDDTDIALILDAARDTELETRAALMRLHAERQLGLILRQWSAKYGEDSALAMAADPA